MLPKLVSNSCLAADTLRRSCRRLVHPPPRNPQEIHQHREKNYPIQLVQGLVDLQPGEGVDSAYLGYNRCYMEHQVKYPKQ
jgi:hypothetical protein